MLLCIMVQFSILKQNKIIETHNVEVYKDDTIENVKFKLSLLLETKNIKEYYFFYKRKLELNPYEIYKQLTDNDKKLLDKKSMVIYCLNHNIFY